MQFSEQRDSKQRSAFGASRRCALRAKSPSRQTSGVSLSARRRRSAFRLPRASCSARCCARSSFREEREKANWRPSFGCSLKQDCQFLLCQKVPDSPRHSAPVPTALPRLFLCRKYFSKTFGLRPSATGTSRALSLGRRFSTTKTNGQSPAASTQLRLSALRDDDGAVLYSAKVFERQGHSARVLTASSGPRQRGQLLPDLEAAPSNGKRPQPLFASPSGHWPPQTEAPQKRH